MKQISVQAFKEIINAESNNTTVDFINVCTPAEYKEKHIAGVRNVPLDEIATHTNEFANKKTVYVHCRSGNRGQKAIETLTALGVTAELINVEGGLLAWDEAGFATNSLTKRMPIMRQTLLAAGSLVILGYVLSIAIAPEFIFLSVFVGAGLTFAGLTGWCGMTHVLAHMPWNKK